MVAEHLGGVSASQVELNMLAGVTPGAVAASKVVTVTVNKNVAVLTNAVFTDTTLAVPAGAVILSVQVSVEAAITGDGSGDDLFALIGIGVSGGDEDAYGNSSAITQNAKINTIPDWAINAGETLALFALKADGNTACTEKFTGGEG